MVRPQGVRILIVEDDRLITKIIRDFFEGTDYTFAEAEDGEEALRLCLLERPNLIIVDLMLPKMDGVTLIKKLRAIPEFSVTPIMVVTSAGPGMQEEARKAGAHLVMQKPIHQEEVTEAVDNLLKASPFVKR
jgi:two-component system chemotaxis response regulator CheY